MPSRLLIKSTILPSFAFPRVIVDILLGSLGFSKSVKVSARYRVSWHPGRPPGWATGLGEWGVAQAQLEAVSVELESRSSLERRPWSSSSEPSPGPMPRPSRICTFVLPSSQGEHGQAQGDAQRGEEDVLIGGGCSQGPVEVGHKVPAARDAVAAPRHLLIFLGALGGWPSAARGASQAQEETEEDVANPRSEREWEDDSQRRAAVSAHPRRSYSAR